jgi:hypothetical protein
MDSVMTVVSAGQLRAGNVLSGGTLDGEAVQRVARGNNTIWVEFESGYTRLWAVSEPVALRAEGYEF